MDLAERLEAVDAGIEDAAAQAGRSANDITTIVVTKFHPAGLVRELHALWVRNVGENRHQEAQAKAAELSDLDLTWHFVGQLQTKKARQVTAYAQVVHSFDREALVGPLEGTDVFIQVNLTADPDRGGVAPDGVERLADLALTGGLNVLGLMAVAGLGAEPRAEFARVREISERLRATAAGASALSMGMSGDFREAILEGATHLRIGTAITGNRPVQG